jgi:2-(1,2-epoxy-1,2-dihydrophenyl)acetyl-CoA isomerase
MTAPPLSVAIEQGLAHLQLTNPTGGNVFNLKMIDAFMVALSEIATATPRAVLITAEGRNFSLGGDLEGMQAASDKAALLAAMAQGLHAGLSMLEALGVPVVTAINGAAAGAGLSLAIAGDIVLGGATSSYIMAYTAIGLSPDGGATFRLPRLIGMRLTQEMALLNRRLDASEALAAGLLTRVVANDALRAEALAIARKLADGPTEAFRETKRLLASNSAGEIGDQFGAEATAITRCAATADAAEGVTAFLAGQRPKFRGN